MRRCLDDYRVSITYSVGLGTDERTHRAGGGPVAIDLPTRWRQGNTAAGEPAQVDLGRVGRLSWRVVTITHDGGEGVSVDELTLEVEDSNGNTGSYDFTDASSLTSGDEVSASDKAVLSTASSTPSPGQDVSGLGAVSAGNDFDNNIVEVQLVWNSAEEDKSDVLATWGA